MVIRDPYDMSKIVEAASPFNTVLLSPPLRELLLQLPAQAQSPTMSGSTEFTRPLWHFDDEHIVTQGITGTYSVAQVGVVFNGIEHGDSGGMSEVVAGALLPSNTAEVVLSSPQRQLLTDPDDSLLDDSGSRALDDYDHQSGAVLILSQSPPRAQSPTVSELMNFNNRQTLGTDNSQHSATIGISTCTVQTNPCMASGRRRTKTDLLQRILLIIELGVLDGRGDPVSVLQRLLRRRKELPDDPEPFLGLLEDIMNLIFKKLLFPSKNQRSRASVAWLHFRKDTSSDSRSPIAICLHCNSVLRAPSTNGTSHLLRHLKNKHRIDSCPIMNALELLRLELDEMKTKKHVESPLQGSASNKYIESEHVEINQADRSTKQIEGTTRSKSKVWKHFTKVVHDEDSGSVKAKCMHCDKLFKAKTSRLRKHITDFHRIKLNNSLKIRKKPVKSQGGKINK